MDPAANIAEMARASGVPTATAFFGERAAGDITAEHGRADVVIARNVLPHVADPHDFLEGIRALLAPGGLAVIEAHYARIILDELHYDSIYHEHLCYFTLQSLNALAAKHGLHLFDVMESPVSGGSLVYFLSLEPRPESEALARIRAEELASGCNDRALWEAFALKSGRQREMFLALLDEESRAGRKVVGYGASARSSTMINYCGVDRDRIAAIADQNSLKHDLYSPGTGIPILEPGKVLAMNPDTVVILAWNFFEEIAGVLRDRYGFTGRLIKPLPYPPVVLEHGDGGWHEL